MHPALDAWGRRPASSPTAMHAMQGHDQARTQGDAGDATPQT